jgi:hypothetical protein
MFRPVVLALCGVVLAAAMVQGQNIVSGPDKDKPVPALKVFDGTGAHVGKEVDYAAERGQKPTAYLFIWADKWDRPMARFFRDLDQEAVKQGGDAAIVAVWLGGDAEKNKTYLPVAHGALKLQTSTLTAYTADALGPNEWGINSDAHLTVVVAGKGKVTETLGYRSINETETAKVAEALKKAAEGGR